MASTITSPNEALALLLKTIRNSNQELILANKITNYGNGSLNLSLNSNYGIGIVGNGNNNISLTGNNNVLTVGNGKDTLSILGNNNLVIVGNGNDSVTLSGINETLFIGNGNNLINALSSSGKDVITAGNGNNTLNLGYAHVASSMVQLSAANFAVTLGQGVNTVHSLTTGSTVINLGNNKNSVDAGVGSSVITGGSGADKMTYEANLNAVAHGGSSIYNAGKGIDVLELKVSYGQLNSAEFKNNVLGFKAAVASGAEVNNFYKFSSIPLSVKGFEQIKIVAENLGAPKASFTPTSVRESTPGAKLGTLSATDIDAKDQHYWLIMNNSANGAPKYVVANESTQVIKGLTWFNGVNGPETLKLAAGAVLDDSTPSMLPIKVAVADIAQLQAIKAGTLQVSALPTHTYNVPVTAVPVPPTSLKVTSPGGNENASIPLNISATTRYAGDVLTYKITGVPAGGSLSAGTHNQDGSWTLTAAQIVGLTFKSGVNQVSGSVTLNVVATSTSPKGLSASMNQSIKVGVNPVADAPILSTQAVSGNENTAIPLNISAKLPVGDTTDVLSVKIGNVPAGATLSSGGIALIANRDGTYTLNPNQLQDLAIKLNGQLSSTTKLALAITAKSMVGTSVATTTATQVVTVNPVADTPILTTHSVSGNEGAAIPLNISALLPAGNTTDVLSVKIDNVPAGATLSSGGIALVANRDGTYTLNASQLKSLALTLNEQLSNTTNIALAITAKAVVGTSVATAKATQVVTIKPVADTPILETHSVSGNEGAAIPLDITALLPSGNTTDVLSLKISNVPAGAILSSGGTTLVANTDGTYTVNASQLQNLALTLNGQLSSTTNIALAITAKSSVGASVAIATATQVVTVVPVADTPTITTQPASGNEGSDIPLDITALLPAGNTTDVLSVTISNVPSGATLSSGGTALVPNTDGTYTLSPSQLEELTIKVTEQLASTTDLSLTVTAKSRVENSVATATATQVVTVVPVADTPTITTQPASGNEGSDIPLDITALLPAGNTTDVLSVTISNVPSGATLSSGGTALVPNTDGTYTLSPSQLEELTIKVTEQLASTTDLSLTVTAKSRVEDSVATATATQVITVAPVADTPTLTTQTASGSEGSAIPLNITALLPAGNTTDVLSVTISDVPTGSTLSSGGTVLVANTDGTYTLSASQLANLTITVNEQLASTTDLSLTVTAKSRVEDSVATATATQVITVAPVADTPTLTTQTASGSEGSAIPLNITALLPAGNTTDVLSVTISDVPTGSTLSSGGTVLVANTDGTYTLSASQLANLTITVNEQLASTTDLSLTVTAKSRVEDSVATATATQVITVAPVADTPTLTTQTVSGSEGSAIPLDITALLPAGNTTDLLSVTISNVPTGSTLSSGGTALVANTDGTYTLSASQLANLTITVNGDLTGTTDLALGVTAYSTVENSVATATATQLVTVTPNASGALSSGADGSTVTSGTTDGSTTAGTITTGSTITTTDGSATAGTITTGSTITTTDGSTTAGTVTSGSTITATDTSTATAANTSTATAADTSAATAANTSAATAANTSAATAADTSAATAADTSTATAADTSTATAIDISTATAIDTSTATAIDSTTTTVTNSSLASGGDGASSGPVILEQIVGTGIVDTSYTSFDSNVSVPTIDLTQQDSILDVSAQSVLSVTASDSSSTVTAVDSSTVTAVDSSTATAVDSSTATAVSSIATADSSIATADSSTALVAGQTAATLSLQGTYTDIGIGGVEVNHTLA
ncbi:beta strand repeat-containing protein [Legionella sp. WA2022007384]